MSVYTISHCIGFRFILLAVWENASFGRGDDVTILLFRPKIAKNKRTKYGLSKSLILGSIVQYPRTSKPHYRTFLERELGTFGRVNG